MNWSKPAAAIAPACFHVQTADDLREGWFADAETVGVTAGTSTPDSAVTAVEQWLLSYAASRGTPALSRGAQELLQPLRHLRAA